MIDKIKLKNKIDDAINNILNNWYDVEKDLINDSYLLNTHERLIILMLLSDKLDKETKNENNA